MPVLPSMPPYLQGAWHSFHERIEQPAYQRQIILVAVCIALFLDNMLYMVIVPIIPDYLRAIDAWTTHNEGGHIAFRHENTTNRLVPYRIGGKVVYEGERSAVGMLFAIKAIVQLFINPFSGALIDRIGSDVPMMIGLSIMFLSTAMFACGRSYGVLFIARSLQGAGSAFADTGGMSMIADRYPEKTSRQKALGIALTFVSFGSLFAPPFGGLLYELAGKEVPFICLSLLCLLDGFLVKIVMNPLKEQMKAAGIERPREATPIYVLMKDRHIMVCAGALVVANVALASLEPTLSIWMKDKMHCEEWQLGIIWLPAFVPYVLGVYSTVIIINRHQRHLWLVSVVALLLSAVSCIMMPFCTSFWSLIVPISILCFGVAQVDTAIMPTLSYIVDNRYVSVYGSVYAIADISYSVAYAFGPVIAGEIFQMAGFATLIGVIALSNVAYIPALFALKNVGDYSTMNENNGEKTVVVLRNVNQQNNLNTKSVSPPGSQPVTKYATRVTTNGGLSGTSDGTTPVITRLSDPIIDPWGDSCTVNPFIYDRSGYQTSGDDSYEMSGYRK